MTSSAFTGVPVAVTGGAHGIGRAIAEHFARAGARVAIGDLDVEAAQKLAAEIGGGAIGVALDVTDGDRVRRVSGCRRGEPWPARGDDQQRRDRLDGARFTRSRTR